LASLLGKPEIIQGEIRVRSHYSHAA
jgi:hypothetical protein